MEPVGLSSRKKHKWQTDIGIRLWSCLVFLTTRVYTKIMKKIGDIIDYNLQILFVGFNPGLRSAETGHHFAGYSNRFWKLLYQSGLTPKQFQPEEDRLLLSLGLGITNIVSRPSREAAEITKEEYAAGREELKRKFTVYDPRVACYEGIGVYRQFAQVKDIVCGRQTQNVVAGIIDFVVPSPSGKNPILFGKQLEYYLELKRLTD